MDNAQLRRFVTVAEELDLDRAAEKLGIPRETLGSSIRRLEAELGFALFGPSTAARLTLTEEGVALLSDARAELARAAKAAVSSSPKSGGKASASKGKGRAPAVKGQPKPGKRRQSR
jgi:DNA-binding transcriptional LysR family regulator